MSGFVIHGTGLETCCRGRIANVQKCAGTPCCRDLHVQLGEEGRQRAFLWDCSDERVSRMKTMSM